MLEKEYKEIRVINVKDIVFSAFEQMEKKLDCRIPKSFFLIVILFLSIKERINFLQQERLWSKEPKQTEFPLGYVAHDNQFGKNSVLDSQKRRETKRGNSISTSDIKTLYYNELLINQLTYPFY